MIIKKNTKEIKRTIFKTEGHGKKERKVVLYLIRIPSQPMIYSIDDESLVDTNVKIEVVDDDPYREVEKGEWPLETFTDFVNGVNAVTKLAVPYIESDHKLEAEAKITETTHVWSTFESEKVSEGILKKIDSENIQKVYFSILGIHSGYVRWEPEMLNPIMELRDEFIKQREDFRQQIISLKSKGQQS